MDDTAPAGPTLALKVIGLLLVFCGTASICSMIVWPFLDGLHLGLGFVLVPVGIGLMKLHRGSRRFLFFLYYFTFTLLAAGTLLLGGAWLLGAQGIHWSVHGGPKIFGKFIGRIPWWVSVGWAVLYLGVCVWIFLVLRRLATKRLFMAAPEGGVPLSGGLRAGVVLAVVLATALTAAALEVRHSYAASDDQWSRASSEWADQLAWGYRWGRLAYIAYRRTDLPPGTNGYTLVSIVSSDSGSATLKMPGEPPVDLPGPHFMYDQVNGHWRTSDFRVTDAEFDAFRQSDPDDYSIEALTAFVRRLRQNRAEE